MSIDTSSLLPLHPDLDLDTLEYDSIQFNLEIDNNHILAQAVPLRHPEMRKPDEIWRHVSGAELWGLLRREAWVDSILLSVTDPILAVVRKLQGEDDHYYISGEEWREFIAYCRSATWSDEEHPRYPNWEWGEDYEVLGPLCRDRVNWIREGF